MLASTIASAMMPSHYPVPGGIAVIALPDSAMTEKAERPVARFGSRELLVTRHDNQWLAMVGLPCDILPGNYIVNFETSTAETGIVDLQVLPIAHGCTDKPHRLNGQLAAVIVLNPQFLQGNIVTTDIAAMATKSIAPQFEFGEVVESRLLIPYGKLIRGKQLELHNYLSYLSNADAQVYAPASGEVLRVEQSEANGATVYLAHGGNVISVLGHLKNVQVQAGQIVDNGEQLGTARLLDDVNLGKVDWGLLMNGYFVNPLQFSDSS